MKYPILSFVVAATLLTGCDRPATDTITYTDATTPASTGPKEDLSARDLVHNPNTADAQEIKSDGRAPVIEFTKNEHDFGLIKPGDVVSHTFEFKNTGKSPLIIENASAACGCTVPEYPREPIAPGGSGKIKVSFDSKGKFGQQSKQVTIRANTQPNITTLTIKGNIPGSPDNAMGPVRQ